MHRDTITILITGTYAIGIAAIIHVILRCFGAPIPFINAVCLIVFSISWPLVVLVRGILLSKKDEGSDDSKNNDYA